jgi:predicted transcriptional regulator of viral defense system
MQSLSTEQKTKSVFRQKGGILRTSELLDSGIHPRTIYQMREKGELIELSRGVFKLADLPPIENSDLIAVGKRVPNGVICLISALSFYNLTDEVPHEVYLAIERGRSTPNIDYPPTRIFHFSASTFSAGVETHDLEANIVKIFAPEKTIADCFKFRNKIGLEVAIEALKRCLAKKGSRAKIIEFAKKCRVAEVIKPYLEAI